MTPAPRIRMTWGWLRAGLVAEIEGASFEARFRVPSLPPSVLDVLSCNAPSELAGVRTAPTPLHRVIAALSRPGPGRAEALDALAPLLPPGSVAFALASPVAFEHMEGFYFGDARLGPARRALATANPSLALALPHVLHRTRLMDAAPLPDARALLAAYAPHADPASVARVLRPDMEAVHHPVLDALLGIPRDWFPGPGPEREALSRIAEAVQPILTLLGDHGFLASSRGRWAEYERRILGPLRANPQAPLNMTALYRTAPDTASAFLCQALLPALLARGVLDERTLVGLGPDVAARLLYGGKSLPAILELSDRWHARQHAIDAAVTGIGLRHGGRASETDRWPVPFEPATAPNGVEVRFLGTSAELVAEGARGADDGSAGLSHCVGGYAHRCLSGATCIASLRVPDGDGFRRLSTASLAVTKGKVSVSEHSGARNAAPPPAAREGLAWFLVEVRAGRLAPSPDYLSEGWRRRSTPRTVRDLCGFDPNPAAAAEALATWAPLLPRPMRDVDGLVAAAMPHLPPPDRGPGDAGVTAGPTDPSGLLATLPRIAVAAFALGFAATVLWHVGMLGTASLWLALAAGALLPVVAWCGGAVMAIEDEPCLGVPAMLAGAVALAFSYAADMAFLGHPEVAKAVLWGQLGLMAAPVAWAFAVIGRAVRVTGRLWWRATRFNARRRRIEAGTDPYGEPSQVSLAGEAR